MELDEDHHDAAGKNDGNDEKYGKAPFGIWLHKEEERGEAKVWWSDEVRDNVRHCKQAANGGKTNGNGPLALGHERLSSKGS
jgi:hypothetical protein